MARKLPKNNNSWSFYRKKILKENVDEMFGEINQSKLYNINRKGRHCEKNITI